MKTKAVRLYGANDLRLEEFELPEIKDDEILVRVMSDSICMSTYKLLVQGKAHNAIFVTNSVECAMRLPLRGLRTYVPGGVINPGTLAVIGSQAVADIKKYNFTKTFLGTNGIAVEPGFTTPRS